MSSINLLFICIFVAKHAIFAARSGHFQLRLWDVKSFYGPALYVNSYDYENKVFQPTKKVIGHIFQNSTNIYLQMQDDHPNIELFFCEEYICMDNFYSFDLICIREGYSKCVTLTENGGKSVPVAYNELVKPLKDNQLFISTEYADNEFSFFVSYGEKLILLKKFASIYPQYILIKADRDFKYKSGTRNILYTNAYGRVSYYNLQLAKNEKYLKFDLSICGSCILRITIEYGRCKDVVEIKDTELKYLFNYYPWKTVSLDITKANSSNITLKFTTFTSGVSGFWAMSEGYRLTEDDFEELHERYPLKIRTACNLICTDNGMWNSSDCRYKRFKRKDVHNVSTEAKNRGENYTIESTSEKLSTSEKINARKEQYSSFENCALVAMIGVTFGMILTSVLICVIWPIFNKKAKTPKNNEAAAQPLTQDD